MDLPQLDYPLPENITLADLTAAYEELPADIKPRLDQAAWLNLVCL